MKDMIYKRIEHTKQNWWEVLYPVLLTYNNKMVHSVTKFTPADAMKPNNTAEVKFNLELKNRHSRKYPNIAIGDYVRVVKKKINWTKKECQTGLIINTKLSISMRVWIKNSTNLRVVIRM